MTSSTVGPGMMSRASVAATKDIQVWKSGIMALLISTGGQPAMTVVRPARGKMYRYSLRQIPARSMRLTPAQTAKP